MHIGTSCQIEDACLSILTEFTKLTTLLDILHYLQEGFSYVILIAGKLPFFSQ